MPSQIDRPSDTDVSPLSSHHTLGVRPNQAAKGNHTHKDLRGELWLKGSVYNRGQVVGYAGGLWYCNSDVSVAGLPPAFDTANWLPSVASDSKCWYQTDLDFVGNVPSKVWQLFWKTGTVTTAYTAVAGEFETGAQALKVSLDTSSAQTLLPLLEENLLLGNEKLKVQVRAKLVSASAGNPTIDVNLYQALNDFPQPFASGGVTTGFTEGTKTLTTSWETYEFTITAPVNNKPRASVGVLVTNGAGAAADVVIQSISVARIPSPKVYSAADLGVSAAANFSITSYEAYRVDNLRYIRFTLARSGATLTGSAVGNIADTAALTTLPADWLPSGYVSFVFECSGTTFGTGMLNTNGSIVLKTLHATGTIASGNSIIASVVYLVA